MMKKVIIGCAFLLIGIIGYFVGVLYEGGATSAEAMKQDLRLRKLWADSDEVFLQRISTSNSLVSGSFVMETWFPDQVSTTNQINLQIVEGKVVFPSSGMPQTNRDGMAETFFMLNNVVSWRQEGIMYEGNAEFVGIVSGDGMWGRMYGWNPGEQAIGFWRIYPLRQNLKSNDK
jgi:hypothetical protein